MSESGSSLYCWSHCGQCNSRAAGHLGPPGAHCGSILQPSLALWHPWTYENYLPASPSSPTRETSPCQKEWTQMRGGKQGQSPWSMSWAQFHWLQSGGEVNHPDFLLHSPPRPGGDTKPDWFPVPASPESLECDNLPAASLHPGKPHSGQENGGKKFWLMRPCF